MVRRNHPPAQSEQRVRRAESRLSLDPSKHQRRSAWLTNSANQRRSSERIHRNATLPFKILFFCGRIQSWCQDGGMLLPELCSLGTQQVAFLHSAACTVATIPPLTQHQVVSSTFPSLFFSRCLNSHGYTEVAQEILVEWMDWINITYLLLPRVVQNERWGLKKRRWVKKWVRQSSWVLVLN